MFIKKLCKILAVIKLLLFSYFSLSAVNTDTTYYVYVSLKGDNVVAVYKINSQDGSLVKVYDQPVSGGPASLALHPSGNYLYVAQRSAYTVSAYSINKTSGRLTFKNSIPVVDNPVYISTDMDGNYLLTAYFSANKAAVYSIEGDGSLKSDLVISVNTGLNPHAINTDPSNQYLYITNMTGNKVQQYQFNAITGDFSALTPSEFVPSNNACPRHFIFHGTKKIMYAVNEVGNSVTVYTVNETSGVLTSLQTISTLPAGFSGINKSADIHITPDNKFLYASNRGHESIAAFRISDVDGTLTPIKQYFTVTSPRAFYIDPTGSYLYAAGETSNNLACYKINKTTGELDSIYTSSVGKTPSWVLIAGFQNEITRSNALFEENIHKPSIHPNPFSVSTSIHYFVPHYSNVQVQIFDISGRLISTLQDSKSDRGFHNLKWFAKDNRNIMMKSGIYYCQINTDYGHDVLKIIYQQ